jgi:hypothetical protein
MVSPGVIEDSNLDDPGMIALRGDSSLYDSGLHAIGVLQAEVN